MHGLIIKKKAGPKQEIPLASLNQIKQVKYNSIMSTNVEEVNSGATTMTDTFRLPFPLVVHLMLEQAEEKGFSSYVSWNSDGTCFKVHDTKGFIANVAPLYFRQTRYKSFQRQLHLYGFSRISSGKNRGYRAHDLFLRGQRNLCVNMKPKKAKKNTPSTSTEPANTMFGVLPKESAQTSNPVEPFEVSSDAIEPTPLSGAMIDPSPITDDIFDSDNVEDGEACLQSFIDRFCESPNQEQLGRGVESDDSPLERYFATDFLQAPVPALADMKDEFAPRMINPYARRVFPEQAPGSANPADYSRLDGMLASFISRAA